MINPCVLLITLSAHICNTVTFSFHTYRNLPGKSRDKNWNTAVPNLEQLLTWNFRYLFWGLPRAMSVYLKFEDDNLFNFGTAVFYIFGHVTCPVNFKRAD